MNHDLTFAPSSRNRNVALALVAVGAVAAIYGVFADPKRAWPSLLLNGFYFASLALSAASYGACFERLARTAMWTPSRMRRPPATV